METTDTESPAFVVSFKVDSATVVEVRGAATGVPTRPSLPLMWPLPFCVSVERSLLPSCGMESLVSSGTCC